jgi:purine-binding chemotaxis protein CheW
MNITETNSPPLSGTNVNNETTYAQASQNGRQLGQSHQYSTFYVAGLFLGIDVLHVQEVLRYQEMTNVPLAPGVIEGLINLRGQIVTAVDLRRRLKLPPRPDGTTPMNIVVRGEEGPVSLLVDEISDVLQMDAGCFELPPQNLPAAQRDLIDGLYKLDGRLLLILNTERVMQIYGGHANKETDSRRASGKK